MRWVLVAFLGICLTPLELWAWTPGTHVFLGDALKVDTGLVRLAEQFEMRSLVANGRMDLDRDVHQPEAQRSCPKCACHVGYCVQLSC